MRSIGRMVSVLLITGLFAGCNSNPGPQEIVRKVKVAQAGLADSLEKKSFPGILREAGEINLAFRVAGSIDHIAVKEGDYVKAGQLIARMDTRDYEVQVQAAQAQYDQVKADAGRVIELYNRGSISISDYDKAVTGERMAGAQLRHAKDQLSDTRLLAPVDGYIQKVNFRENELIDAGMPVATLLDLNYYQIEIDIPVSLYLKRDDIVSYTGIQPFLPDQPFDLRLLNYSKKANQNQLYSLRLGLCPDSRTKLAPGMDIQVEISYSNPSGLQTCISLDALFHREGRTHVWIYEPQTQIVSGRLVTTGMLTGDGRIRITEGLEPGEYVVVAGVSLLNEGQKVMPLEPASKSNTGGLL